MEQERTPEELPGLDTALAQEPATSPPPATRPPRLVRTVRRLEALGEHPRVVRLGVLLGLVTAAATVAGWLWLVAEPMVGSLLGPAVVRTAADTAKSLDDLLAEKDAEIGALRRLLLAEQERGLAKVSVAQDKVGRERVAEALRHAARGDRAGAEAILRELGERQAEDVTAKSNLSSPHRQLVTSWW
jgi:hypothetical protein